MANETILPCSTTNVLLPSRVMFLQSSKKNTMFFTLDKVSSSIQLDMYSSRLTAPSGQMSMRPPGKINVALLFNLQASIAFLIPELEFSKLFGFTPKSEAEIIVWLQTVFVVKNNALREI